MNTFHYVMGNLVLRARFCFGQHQEPGLWTLPILKVYNSRTFCRFSFMLIFSQSKIITLRMLKKSTARILDALQNSETELERRRASGDEVEICHTHRWWCNMFKPCNSMEHAISVQHAQVLETRNRYCCEQPGFLWRITTRPCTVPGLGREISSVRLA